MESQHGSQESTSSGGTGDFHSAMETFAEAWVAVNTETALTSDGQVSWLVPVFKVGDIAEGTCHPLLAGLDINHDK